MTDKEKTIIDGVDVSGCEYVCNTAFGNIGCKLPFNEEIHCCNIPNCYFKQLAHKTQIIDEVEEVIKPYQEQIELDALSLPIAIESILERKTQECEELKKQLMQKSEVDMFFNTPIEGWSNDPCGICPHKAENEELKKEIINKNEKIKELRFSVSDLTNRLCYLNAEKSFRIVDLEQALDEIEKELKEDIYCENQECGCDDFEECLKCTKEHILDIIIRAKGGKNDR